MQLDFVLEMKIKSNCIKLRKHKTLRHNAISQEKQRSVFFLIESMPNRNFAKLQLKNPPIMAGFVRIGASLDDTT